MRFPICIHVLLFALALGSADAKPTIWVYTDLSDPRDQRTGGHPQNDPDDICSLAALLLEANRFDIAGIVFSSTNRKGLKDATPFVESTFAEAYAMARKPLNKALGGFQESIPFYRSCLYQGGDPVKFDPEVDYSNLDSFPTVDKLIQLATNKQVYVLNWGPTTESAIAVKHCLDSGNLDALENITVISHWTKSWIAQGTPEQPFKVANCRDDGRACSYLHETAKAHPSVKFIELGSVGQTGVVNGSSKYPNFHDFQSSALGQIFVHSKFYHGKPDQSDGSTFWLLTEAFGPTLSTYSHDGTLDQQTEETARDLFIKNGHAIQDDLLKRSRIAAEGGAFSTEFIASRFTYVYQFLDGRYSIYVPYEANYTFLSPSGETVMEDTVGPGNHQLDLSSLDPATYKVVVTTGGLTREFSLTVGR